MPSYLVGYWWKYPATAGGRYRPSTFNLGRLSIPAAIADLWFPACPSKKVEGRPFPGPVRFVAEPGPGGWRAAAWRDVIHAARDEQSGYGIYHCPIAASVQGGTATGSRENN